jgi:hypothetical protein
MQHAAAKNPNGAAGQLVLDTIHPDDKGKLLADLDKYPLLATTLTTALIDACAVANLGNG